MHAADLPHIPVQAAFRYISVSQAPHYTYPTAFLIDIDTSYYTMDAADLPHASN
jgi:hypothetical protein